MQPSKIALIVGGAIPRQQWDLLQHVVVYDAATMPEAVNIAVNLVSLGQIEAIISPAGTASEIRKKVDLPIVEANPTQFDILESLRYAEKQSGQTGDRVALVLHHSRQIELEKIQGFLNNEVVLFLYRDEDDIAMLVDQVAAQGIPLLVGGPTAQYFAALRGIRNYVLRLGKEALRIAIGQAQDLIQYGQKEREQSFQLSSILRLFPDGVMLLDSGGVITECNSKAAGFFGLSLQQVIGMHIEELAADPGGWKEVYQKGEQKLDRLIEMPGVSLFSNRMPIVLDGQVRGAIVTLQDAGRIEKLEHTYRKHRARGLVAKYHFRDIIGRSAAVAETIQKAKAFSAVDSSILIEADTGTGKELFAQSIHNYSHRKSGPFVAINCAALPENLLESELMGYEEGAFTGARRGGKAGLFELAHTGTIFLDEINQLPIQLQARILRVLQEKQVLRLGGSRMIPIDVRIISASNEPLGGLIREKRFREDLYYRLKVLSLAIPPLRERREDIPPLINYYFEIFTRQYGPTHPFGDNAVDALTAHAWPGNVRELVNCVEQYVVINRQLDISDMSFVSDYIRSERKSRAPESGALAPDLNQLSVTAGTLEEMENQLIRAVLERHNDNRLLTAMALGISRTTLWKKLQDEHST